jgi:PadR family transcriptional regulator PadR
VPSPFRVTDPTLDVLETLLSAGDDEVHGWAIMKMTKRTGPTVYQILERLSQAQWIDSRWEDQGPAANRPRRRFYRLTAHGAMAVRSLLAERRPVRPSQSTKPSLG